MIYFANCDRILSKKGGGDLIINIEELATKMLSDAGQLMKDPLNNLYNAIKDLEDPQKKEDAIGVIKHSFYSLVRLSENQIALAGANTPEVHTSMTLVPIAGFVQDVIASVNETLDDIGITVELTGELSESHFCNIYTQKLTQIIILLISNAARGLAKCSAIEVGLRFDNRACYIEIPVSDEVNTIFDASSYMNTAGTPQSLPTMENLMLVKMFSAFNNIHDSRIFMNNTKDGQNTVVIAINTEIGGMVSEPQTASPGLRPDLIFLSEILSKVSYM